MFNRYDIIINPLGGKGKSLKALAVAEKMLKAAGAEYAVHNTEYAGHATELARELSGKPDAKILVFGGDGSFNPNSTYTGWNWILARDQGGKWSHVDHGY